MSKEGTITICGSMTFFDEMNALRQQLQELGWTVYMPKEEPNVDYSQLIDTEKALIKKRYIDAYIPKIKAADIVLIANYDKHGVAGYVGANTLMEMAFAYVLEKDIVLLNKIPEQQSATEIESMQPRILSGDLSQL